MEVAQVIGDRECAEPAGLQHDIARLDAGRAAVPFEQLRLRTGNPDGADNRDLAPIGVEHFGDRLAPIQPRQFVGGERGGRPQQVACA